MRSSRDRKTISPARRGFTLVEVIVAGVIAALVIGAVSTSLGNLGQAKRTSKERFDTFVRADAALTALRRDITSVIRADDLFFTRFQLTDSSTSGPGGTLGRDEIVVFTTRLRPVRDVDNFTGEGVEYETQYRIEDDELGPVLWQRRDAVPDDYPLGGGMAVPLVEGILGLDVEAYDGEDWWNEWDSDIRGLPVAVSITVTASGHRDGNDPWDAPIQSLRTVVPIDRVLQPRDIFETEEMELREIEAEEAAADAAANADDDAAGIASDGDTTFEVDPGTPNINPGAGGTVVSTPDGDVVIPADSRAPPRRNSSGRTSSNNSGVSDN